MARALTATIALCSVALAGLAACAEGSAISDLSGAGGSLPSGSGGASGIGGAGGAGDDDDGSSTRASSAASGPTSSATSSSSSGGDGGAGGGSGEGGAGEGGAGSTSSTSSTSSTGGGPVCDFTSPNQCASAENLGSVAGDESGPAITVQGTTSKWFKIRIEERASGVSETDLSYRASLTSPAGMNYDLFVTEGPQDGDATCGGVPKVGLASGASEEVSASWDDDQGFGGEDDSLWLSIEVRHVSGDQCDLDDRWTLSVQGYP